MTFNAKEVALVISQQTDLDKVWVIVNALLDENRLKVREELKLLKSKYALLRNLSYNYATQTWIGE